MVKRVVGGYGRDYGKSYGTITIEGWGKLDKLIEGAGDRVIQWVLHLIQRALDSEEFRQVLSGLIQKL